ncbi:DENN domain-containing protein 1B-like [Sinocyclocheilus anshuiensis]|uniref:DENN domain-containing protein 1B-like n=1 Tax=Sinocyclocheilus anshuiensis TaxID=1608454 RepID=UPI0007B7FF3F|nr:PREDICTED: DENN domain-containing protein 1B-like [Sinocyclocheilus anshuiensis]
MGSRIKENPEKTFYWFFQASCPIARDKDPDVLFHFPEDFNDEESLQSLPRFCFPYDIERVKDTVTVQHFTFVLTDLEGCQRFGFCRLTSSSQTCLCILSYLPWFEVFYKLLNNLADYSTKGQTNEMKELLSVLYKHPMPPANGSITLQMGGKLMIGSHMPGICGHAPKGEESEGIPYFIAPDPKALPSIPESRNLTELVVAVDVGNLLQLYASMLFERRILIYCSKLSTLTACIHACNGMLYPMYWQHIFIPVLPPHLLDYCCAPMPYLIGIHSSLAERVRSRALEDVVILNVDTNTLESPYEDLKKIPADVVAGLKVRLKRQAASAGSGVAHAFLRAQALLFGGYRDALRSSDEGPVVFCNELFLGHKSQSMREFLESAVHLQCFKEFIDGRLTMLDQGKEPDDVFEEEVLQCGASSGGSKLRRQWVGNLKKGGGALIVTWKTTANKATKYHSKFGLKNLMSSKDQSEPHMLQRGGSVCGTHTYRLIQSDCLQNRLPITQHFGRSRPRRPTRKQGTSSHQGNEQQTEDDNTTYEDSVTESLEQCSGTSDLQEDDELSLLADPEEMDLLSEIFDTLSAQSSREPGLLYGTRSLDLFSSDSSEFISHKSLTNPSQESLSPSFGNSGSLMSCEEELEEGPGGEGEEPDVLTDRPENELKQLEKDLTELGENLCSDLQILEDASLDPEVGSQEQQKDSWSKNDGQMNGTMEESLETETEVTERTEMQPDKEELQKEHKTTNDLGPNGPTNEGITSAVSHNVKIDKREELDKKSIEPLSPNVLSTVALFQSSADSSGSRGWDKSLKTPIRTHKINVGPMTGLQTEEQSMKSPVSSTPEEQTQAPIKVSELKKRFEH